MIAIATYQELSDFVAAFGNGHMNMLVICSRGGLGKSETVRRALDEENMVYIGGHITPLELYAKLHDGRDKPVLFDEIDGMLSEVKHVGLLKQLCETREVKKVMWGSTDRRAEQIDGGAGYFCTRSRVLMLCNSFASFSANVAALKTRGLTIQFLPDSREIMSKIKSFATDSEIVAFLEHFHECVPDFSLRTYRVLQDLKRAGLDWRKYALDETKIPPKVREVTDLLTRFSNDAERVEYFSGCRRSYYDWKPKAIEHLRRQSLKTLKLEPDGSHNQGSF